MKALYKKEIRIRVNQAELSGELVIPADSGSLVIFSHGSGSSRFSPRNNFVAGVLQQAGISTFLVDLLTAGEDEEYSNRFNINLLTERLIDVTRYMSLLPETALLKLGYFGASTGAASALYAASELPKIIHAVVSRGGRPDLAFEALGSVEAPTLLIVGSLDQEVLKLNRQAFNQLKCVKELEIVNGASHLFEEPGTLKQVALLASNWFGRQFKTPQKQMLTFK